jgi:hypothetical protein
MAHQGHHNQDVLETLCQEVKAAHPDWRVGAAVSLPRYTPATHASLVGRIGAVADYVLADPETHRLEHPYEERGGKRDRYDYLQESDPIANRSRFVPAVMEAQRFASPSREMTPWLTFGTEAFGRNLRATIRFAEQGAEWGRVNRSSPLIGLAATEAAITDDDARGDLLDEIVELEGDAVYFRLLVRPPESFTQYRNDLVLCGLRQFVSSLAENGKPPILAQFGLGGWLFLPLGALAFGSGINGSMQKFSDSSGFGQPLEWYFFPDLLGFVLREEVDALARVPGFSECPCPYCPRLPLTSAGVWDRNDAGAHYLWWCAQLANEAGTEVSVTQRLSSARDFWNRAQTAGLVLDPRSIPRHLEVWSGVVT